MSLGEHAAGESQNPQHVDCSRALAMSTHSCWYHESSKSGGHQLRRSLVYLLCESFFFFPFLFPFFRELIEMLAISRSQKLLQAGEENQVSGFFLNSKPNHNFCKFPVYIYFMWEQKDQILWSYLLTLWDWYLLCIIYIKQQCA